MQTKKLSGFGTTKRYFTIGVTGHRSAGLGGANLFQLRNKVRDVLALFHHMIQILDPNASMRILSPLAEGADQIVAQEGLFIGYELHCILPFDSNEYIKYFDSQEGAKEFNKLLDRANTIIQLNGKYINEKDRKAAYLEAGRIIMVKSDILIAIWDGRPERGLGGTAQIVKEALKHNNPVFWIKSDFPHEILLLTELADIT